MAVVNNFSDPERIQPELEVHYCNTNNIADNNRKLKVLKMLKSCIDKIVTVTWCNKFEEFI